MSKARMEYARELIREKQYGKARAILKEVDHPTARQWLVRLDELDPPQKAGLQPAHIVGILVGILVVFAVVILAFFAGQAATNSTIPTVASVLPTVASNLAAQEESEASPTQPLVAQVTATDTNVPATATLTDIPATATITNTPQPTRTPRPTSTPRPTRTPVPTFAVQIQQIGPIYDSLYDESFSVEMTLRSVEFTQGDGFERLGAGRVYAIAEVNVRNLGPGALRSMSSFSFQVKDGNGAIRDASLFLMFTDCDFDFVDLTAGGSISGCVAFEVPDTGSLELIYAPFQYEGLQPGRYISFRIR